MNDEPKYNLPLIEQRSEDCIDLIKKMLIKDPEERITIQDALNHKFFTQLEPKTADSPLVKRSLEKKMSLCGPDKSNKFGGIAVEELERIDN